MKKKTLSTIIFVSLIGLLTSCVTNPIPSGSIDGTQSPNASVFMPITNTPWLTHTLPVQTKTPTRTQTSSPSATATIMPSITTPSPTMGPTYTTDERNDHLIELLELNRGCEFPCYWGFIPGTTKWIEISRFLAYMGDASPWETTFQGNPLYSVEYQDNRDNIVIPIDFYVKDDVVDFIMSQVLVRNNSAYIREFEEIYAIHPILLAYGKPSRILVQLLTGEVEYPSSTILFLWIFYDQKGFAILFMPKANKSDLSYETCPNKLYASSNSPLQFELIMQAPNNTRPLERIYTLLGMKISGYISLDEATGIDTNAFYNLIVSGDQSACISTPRNIWP